MNLPESVPALLLFFTLVVPGVVFSWVRGWTVGPQGPRQDEASRVLDALVAGTLFAVTYGGVFLLIAGGTGEQAFALLEDLWRSWPGWGVVAVYAGLLLLVPAVLAFSLSAKFAKIPTVEGGEVVTKWRRINRYRSIPRGWEKAAFGAYSPRLVRVRVDSGEWFGGWYDSNSLMSTYPHERDLFIEYQWKMGPNGEFVEAMIGSLGVWVPITDRCVVEWMAADPEIKEGVDDRREG